MMFQRGDVVLVPFPYTDLSAAKTRPAVVISGSIYHTIRSELLLAYTSSQIAKAHPQLDYLLLDWSAAHLPKPSFVRPKIASVEPTLIVHRIGQLSGRDLQEVDRRLIQAMSLTQTVFANVVTEVTMTEQPPNLVQALAEKAVAALVILAQAKTPDIRLETVSALLNQYGHQTFHE